MKQYQELLQDILDNGRVKGDRTGTGTISTFGRQLRFDLSEGFPLLTTKKVFTKGIIHELLWFISGNTNNNLLNENGVHIWDEWACDNGNLGPIYSVPWRFWPVTSPIEDIHIRVPDVSHIKTGSIASLDDGNEEDEMQLWMDTLSNSLYNDEKVCSEWLDMKRFYQDIQSTPGYHLWVSAPDNYELSCKYMGVDVYSKYTCIFIPRSYAQYLGTNVTSNNIDRETIKNNGTVIRRRLYIDQISNALRSLRENPTDRRIIISAWNPETLPDTKMTPKDNAALGKASLPPCHTLFQFYCEEATDDEIEKYIQTHGEGGELPKYRLSCQLYQRSADVFLGVPFNIASYALLTHMMANITNMIPGDFVHTFGDVHIYNNHIDAVKEQLSREPRPLPKLKIHREVGEFSDPSQFSYEDFEIVGYDPHPAIKVEVSV